MAKWCGMIGFATMEEIRPGVWDNNKIVEKEYFGDIIQLKRREVSSDKLNDDIQISNQLSIVADPFVNGNLKSIKYVEFMGIQWKVSDIDASTYPRLILTLGGVYNGPKA